MFLQEQVNAMQQDLIMYVSNDLSSAMTPVV